MPEVFKDGVEPSEPDRAVIAGGAHSIKFTEACLREYAINPNPVYLVAACDVTERVGPV